MVLAVFTLLLAFAFGRKSFLVKEHHSPLLAPKLYAYDTKWSVFDKNGYSL